MKPKIIKSEVRAHTILAPTAERMLAIETRKISDRYQSWNF